MRLWKRTGNSRFVVVYPKWAVNLMHWETHTTLCLLVGLRSSHSMSRVGWSPTQKWWWQGSVALSPTTLFITVWAHVISTPSRTVEIQASSRSLFTASDININIINNKHSWILDRNVIWRYRHLKVLAYFLFLVLIVKSENEQECLFKENRCFSSVVFDLH